MSRVISRKEAVALGLKRYFTGKPCVRGHVAERYLPGGNCLKCSRERDRSDRVRDGSSYQPKPKTSKSCVICQTEFLARPQQKTCSKTCGEINRVRVAKRRHKRRYVPRPRPKYTEEQRAESKKRSIEKHRERTKLDRKSNPEKWAALQREWRRRNPESDRASVYRWRQKNLLKHREMTEKAYRKARIAREALIKLGIKVDEYMALNAIRRLGVDL